MEITFCPNCGHQNQPGSRFCEQCGCDLMKAAHQAGQHNIQKRHIKIGGFDEIRRRPAILGQRTAVPGAGQRHLDQPRDQVLILHDQYVVHPRFLPVWGYCNPVLLQGCVLTAIILHFFILFSTRIVV